MRSNGGSSNTAPAASAASAAPRELVVGVVFPAKKIGHLRDVLTAAMGGVRFVLINLADEALRSPADLVTRYGTLDVLLHKLAHEMVFARLGDAEAARRLKLMQEYVAQHQHLTVLDPIESVQLLTDRHAACEMLLRLREDAQRNAGSAGHVVPYSVPPFRVVDSAESHDALLRAIDSGDTALPLICKSVEACATDRSHLMSVVTQRTDLQRHGYPVLYQEFINHSGRLYKGYVLGDLINVAQRRSLPNLAADARHVAFNTQEQYPTEHDFHASPVSDVPLSSTSSTRTQEEIFTAVRAIGERIREKLKLSLFGFDVIVSDSSHEYFVIDVNYFPSYKELDDFGAILRCHIRQTYERTHVE